MSSPTAPEVVRSRVPKEIWVLVAAAFVIAIGYGLIAPVLPRFAKSFDVGIQATSFIISAFAFCRLVFAPAGGGLVNRWGERPTYLMGLVIVAVSTGAAAFAGSYWQLLVFRGLGGIGSTMFTVSAMGLIVRLSPFDIRGHISSVYGSAWLIGGVAGPLLGGQLAQLGFRVPFLVYAVSLLIAAAVVAGMLPDVSVRPTDVPDRRPPLRLRDAFHDSAYRAALVSGFANGWANFGVRVALIPLFVTGALMATDVVTGYALAIFAVGNAAILSFSGRIADRAGRRPLIILGLLVNGIFTLCLAVSASVPVLYAVSLLAGAGAGLLNPSTQAAMADIIGRDRSGGQALTAFQMAGDLGSIIGPVVAGGLADRWGFGAGFAATGVLTMTAALAWVIARETLVPADPHPTQIPPVMPPDDPA